ncbi:10 kDa heat shock protein, mitochondrial-like [Balaenoptera acutorostrata]|uniref:10 kDa heat shock protein, mitochondrial n=1 Tax=Balaenoptera acutorostrata TaxID=9767 RepID=A0ABM3UA37_BALAC|nr:10 kDa heat shock protein, mitochondrial-like [Balaenoptera acutorostrata]
MAGQAFRKFLPLFDRVLVERSAPEVVTKGGIMLPEKSQGKVLQAMVVAVGSGSKGKGGEIQPVSVKVGDKVLLPEYGGTKVVLDDKDSFLFRDGDILGKYIDENKSLLKWHHVKRLDKGVVTDMAEQRKHNLGTYRE